MELQQIERLSDDTKKLTPRTRFLLKDLIELRKNNYVPRRAQETAKTISQVRTYTHTHTASSSVRVLMFLWHGGL